MVIPGAGQLGGGTTVTSCRDSVSAFSLVSTSARGLEKTSTETVFRVLLAPIEWPRKSFVTPDQSNVRFDIDFTVTGGSLIVLVNA